MYQTHLQGQKLIDTMTFKFTCRRIVKNGEFVWEVKTGVSGTLSNINENSYRCFYIVL